MIIVLLLFATKQLGVSGINIEEHSNTVIITLADLTYLSFYLYFTECNVSIVFILFYNLVTLRPMSI